VRLALVLAYLLCAGDHDPGAGRAGHLSESSLESQLMCPVCHTLLDNSQSARPTASGR